MGGVAALAPGIIVKTLVRLSTVVISQLISFVLMHDSCHYDLAWHRRTECKRGGSSKKTSLLDIMVLGRKGAALAALGEMVAGLRPAVASLVERKEGVKLGESTLRDFFM